PPPSDDDGLAAERTGVEGDDADLEDDGPDDGPDETGDGVPGADGRPRKRRRRRRGGARAGGGGGAGTGGGGAPG
ncbi:MAG: hypothetical protein ACOYOB_19455, partial [Myxococcota bacterium]